MTVAFHAVSLKCDAAGCLRYFEFRGPTSATIDAAERTARSVGWATPHYAVRRHFCENHRRRGAESVVRRAGRAE